MMRVDPFESPRIVTAYDLPFEQVTFQKASTSRGVSTLMKSADYFLTTLSLQDLLKRPAALFFG